MKIRVGLIHLMVLIIGQFLAPDAHAALRAQLDRGRISEGETVRLIVEADRQSAGQPDVSPLDKDFEVLGISSGSQVNIINGQVNARTTWTITLSPKRIGNLRVPPLALGGEQSPSLALEVRKAPVASNSSAGIPVFIETKVDRTDPYVQGMVRYTIRIFHSVDLFEGRLQEVHLDDAVIRRLGKDRDFAVNRDGRQYRVIEREYAIFPQASGELRLPAPVLDAQIPDSSEVRRDPLQGFFGGLPFGRVVNATKQVRVRGEVVVLNVLPRPDQASGRYWLPAENVTLNETWQPSDGKINVGDPITRTITIRAQGLMGKQLPDLEPGSLSDFKVYPDEATDETREVTGKIEGEKIRRIAFVPIKPGRFTLPSIRLNWWNTESDEERIAELPAHSVEVIAASYSSSASTQIPEGTQRDIGVGPPSPQTGEDTFSEGTISSSAGVGEELDEVGPVEQRPWLWVSILLGGGWALTLVLWRREKRLGLRGGKKLPSKEGTNTGIGAVKKQFLSACRANDPHSARHALLELAAAYWPNDPPKGLDELAQRMPDACDKEALVELDRALYGGNSQDWNGSALKATMEELPDAVSERRENSPLPDLYARA